MLLEGSEAVSFERLENGEWHDIDGAIVREGMVRLHVNGQELVTMICTPKHLDLLVLGFLRNEGLIQDMADVRLVHVCPSRTCVEVWLRNPDFVAPKRRIITSGCGGGITFSDLTAGIEPIESDLKVSVERLGQLMAQVQEAGALHRELGGTHTSGLVRGSNLEVVVEDVGRHNTIDKLCGYCLRNNVPTHDSMILTSGRISSEMLFKAARMGVPIVATRTSPTSLSVQLANAWNVTLAGYVRRNSLNVYAGRARLIDNREEQTHANS